jgi:predicted metalloprotease with PDZ domain
VAVPEPNASATSYATESDPETLVLDASTAGRGFATATMGIPVMPGPFTFVYPEWIPGDHGPTGPLAGIAQLEVTADGQTLAWARDKVDMYAFHVDVPQGVSSIKVRFTVVLNAPDPVSTANLAIINWNRALFYQNDTNSHQVYLKASIILPPGWGYGTALPVAHQVGQRIDFNEVALNQLVDSPVDMGRYYEHVLLWQDGDAHQWLDMFADAPQDLEIPANVLDTYRRMVPEALALYGSRHWKQDYHSLLTLSSRIEFNGIEHHESSDNRTPPGFMTDPKWQLIAGDLLTHELSHSWNGKYRRPWDLYTLNYQIPQRTDLLWVYEGMNKYLGDLLSFRAGMRKPSLYPEYLALMYSEMASEPGRDSDPLIDVATGAPYLYQAQGDYPSLRRTSEDFYVEGELLWLDVDTIIRSRTQGRESLDTFLHLYSQPERTGPIVKTYTRADIERLLNEVAPYDWHAFFQHHVYEPTRLPPTGELARSGWRLVYNAEPNLFLGADDTVDLTGYQWSSYGFNVGKDDTLSDVRAGSPAWQAGLSPGMKIEAVDGQAYSPDVLRYVMTQAEKSKQPTAFLVSQDGWFRTIEVSYFGGPRYPHLVRIKDKPDLLGQIMAPHAGS